LGLAFERVKKVKGKSVSTIESCEREISCNSYYFLLCFQYNFFPPPHGRRHTCRTTLTLVFLCFVVISHYCLLVLDRFYAFVTESLGVFSYCVGISQQGIWGQVSLRFTTGRICTSISRIYRGIIGIQGSLMMTLTTGKPSCEIHFFTRALAILNHVIVRLIKQFYTTFVKIWQWSKTILQLARGLGFKLASTRI